MAERYPERNWEQSNRERESYGEERYSGQRPAWRQGGFSGYGASLAPEMPFYGTEQFGSGQMLQQPFTPGIHQPFQPAVQQPFTPNIPQQYFYQPFGVPFQQPMYSPQQQIPYALQQPFGFQQPGPIPQQYGYGIPQQPQIQQQLPPGIQQSFGQPIQQPFHTQPTAFNQLQQPPIGFNQPAQQPFGQQQGQSMQQLQRGRFTGRGPKNYRRPDERIREDAMERLTTHPDIDATNIDISVKNGEITLKGTVEDRLQKRLVEDLVETVFGVIDVQNQLRVEQTQWNQFAHVGGAEKEEASKVREK